MLGNKLFLKCKTNNFSMKEFFSFSNSLRFHAVNMKDFRSDLRATYTRHALQNLCKKTSFLAIDATTQSSKQEENDNFILFYFIAKSRNKEK
jgi:hypothetical protein